MLYCQRKLILFLFLCLGVATSVSVYGDPKTNKKKQIIIETPEPDPLATQAKRGHDLKVPSEAPNPLAIRGGNKEGIDVSHYQGFIDWTRVAQEGEAGYVYIKATEGNTIQDDTYTYNILEARRAGIKVGSYHFFRANVNVDEQIANFTSIVKKEQQDLIPLIDVEHTNGVSSAALVQRLKEFLTKIERYYGKKPMLYTYVNFYNKHFIGTGLDKYPLMIAFYRDAQPELYDGKRYTIWQYSSKGQMPGIRGHVDRSIIMDDFYISDILLKRDRQ